MNAEVALEGRLAKGASPGVGIVLCHPHPLYGGDMENPVVVRAAEVCAEAGRALMQAGQAARGGGPR